MSDTNEATAPEPKVDDASASTPDAEATAETAAEAAAVATAETAAEAAAETQAERWKVRLASGEERSMTLDELDAAYNDDVVDADTRVQEPGSESWVRLGEILGLDDAAAPASASASAPIRTAPASMPPVSAPAPASSMSPVAIEAAPSAASMPPPSRASVASVAPVESPASPDLDDLDLESPAFRSKKKGFVIGLVAVGLLAAAAVVALKVGDAVDAQALSADVKAASALAAPAAATAPAPATDLADVPSSKDKLSEEQKRRLLDADKARDGNQKTRTPSGAPAAPRRPNNAAPANGKAPFVQDGDKYDPMNGSL